MKPMHDAYTGAHEITPHSISLERICCEEMTEHAADGETTM